MLGGSAKKAVNGKKRNLKRARKLEAALSPIDLDAAELQLAGLRRVLALLREDRGDEDEPPSADVLDFAAARLADFVEAQDRTLAQGIAAVRVTRGVHLPHSAARRRRELRWGAVCAVGLELLSQASDALFLWTALRPLADPLLYRWSALALAAVLLARLWMALRERRRVGYYSRCRFVGGTLLALIEPASGLRQVQRSLAVDSTADPTEAQATADLRAARVGWRDALLLALLHDGQQMAIQVCFVLRARLSLGAALRDHPVFLLACVTTLLHLARQLTEAWALGGDVALLRRKVAGWHHVFEPTSTSDVTVEAYAKGTGLLARRVALQHCTQIGDGSLDALSLRCPGIVQLSLRGCSGAGDEGLAALAARCAGIRSFDLSGCGVTDAGVAALAEACHDVLRMDLGMCNGITDASAAALASCANLTHLDVSSCSISDRGVKALAAACPKLMFVSFRACDGITDAGVVTLANGCSSISALNLKGCKKVGDNGVAAVASGCSKLIKVFLGDTGITDTGVQELAQECDDIQTIHLERTAITSEGVVALADGCRDLTKLDLSGCEGLDDKGLIALGTYSSALTQIDLSTCTAISDDGVMALAKGCPALKKAGLSGCTGVDQEGVDALTRACKHVHIRSWLPNAAMGGAPKKGARRLPPSKVAETAAGPAVARNSAAGATAAMLKGGAAMLQGGAMALSKVTSKPGSGRATCSKIVV
jgi:hypothetical protein